MVRLFKLCLVGCLRLLLCRDVIMMTLALWAQKESNSSAAVDSLSQFNASQTKTLGAAAAASAAASSETHRLCAANHGTRRTVYVQDSVHPPRTTPPSPVSLATGGRCVQLTSQLTSSRHTHARPLFLFLCIVNECQGTLPRFRFRTERFS